MAGLTGIFDDIYVKQLFQKNERGETVFYPFGLIGRGYLLPKEREADVRQATRLLTLASLIASISLGPLVTRVSGSAHSVSLGGWLALGAIFSAILAASSSGLPRVWSRRGSALRPANGCGAGGRRVRRGRIGRPSSLASSSYCLLSQGPRSASPMGWICTDRRRILSSARRLCDVGRIARPDRAAEDGPGRVSVTLAFLTSGS